MEHRKVMQLDESSNFMAPLRRPRGNPQDLISTVAAATNSQDTPNIIYSSIDDIALNSTLKVSAKEFYPKNYQNQGLDAVPPATPSAIQKRLLVHKGSTKSTSNLEPTEPHIVDFEKLEEIINTLTSDPGQFDQLIDLFLNILRDFEKDIDNVTYVTQMIFFYAVNEPNFVYTAARLCKAIGDEYPLFRPTLHSLCEQNLEKDCSSSFILFVAELYSQIGEGNIYGKIVIQGLFHLLNKKDCFDSIKTVCQTLKLAGSFLERYQKQELDEIFNKLQDPKNENLPVPTINLIASVENLRRENWGQDENHSSTMYNEYRDPVDNGIEFYGDDEFELNDEEKQFLTENLSQIGSGDNYDEPEWEMDPAMDEEVQKAFYEFLLNK